MTDHKERVTLAEAQETLLIPLYSKASESKRHNPIFDDPKAVDILARVDYDFAHLRVPRKTTMTLCFRANRLDAVARAFLSAHPQGTVVHLGCGLDSRCLRVGHAGAQWFDLDLPDVIELRRKFYDETPTYHMIPSSVMELSWTDLILIMRDRPDRAVLVIAEGLLMYLDEAQVKALVLRLKEVFPGCELAFDAFSVFTVRRVGRHPSLRQTGAVVRWGIDDPKQIEQWAPGIRLQEEWFFRLAPEISRLEAVYRFASWLAGQFPMANRAHRILRYCL